MADLATALAVHRVREKKCTIKKIV
jgi:hypothetical protein